MLNILFLLGLLGKKVAMAAKARYILREGFHRMGVQHILRNDPRSVPLKISEWKNVIGVEVLDDDTVQFTGLCIL